MFHFYIPSLSPPLNAYATFKLVLNASRPGTYSTSGAAPLGVLRRITTGSVQCRTPKLGPRRPPFTHTTKQLPIVRFIRAASGAGSPLKSDSLLTAKSAAQPSRKLSANFEIAAPAGNMPASPIVLLQQQDIHHLPKKAASEINQPNALGDRAMSSVNVPNGEKFVKPDANGNGNSVPGDAVNPENYSFPDHKLKEVMDDSSRIPLLLVACGSFSPITYLHLRMFEMAADYTRIHSNFEFVGGYLSPVSDAYKKKGLANAEHRIHMCQLASEPAPFLMVDHWEASFEEYTRTAVVLDHFDREINVVRQGIATKEGGRKPVRIALLAGADLIGTMSAPGVWSGSDLDHILGKYGAFIIERSGTNIDEALANLQKWRNNITVIKQLIQNDVSSTKIRSFLEENMSVNYLIPPPVIKYIQQHGLYADSASLHKRQSSENSTVPEEENSRS